MELNQKLMVTILGAPKYYERVLPAGRVMLVNKFGLVAARAHARARCSRPAAAQRHGRRPARQHQGGTRRVRCAPRRARSWQH